MNVTPPGTPFSVWAVTFTAWRVAIFRYLFTLLSNIFGFYFQVGSKHVKDSNVIVVTFISVYQIQLRNDLLNIIKLTSAPLCCRLPQVGSKRIDPFAQKMYLAFLSSHSKKISHQTKHLIHMRIAKTILHSRMITLLCVRLFCSRWINF